MTPRTTRKALPAEDPLARHVRAILSGLGEDPGRRGIEKTPARYAKALRELTSGSAADFDALFNGALFPAAYNEMVLVKDIPFYSLCVPSKQHVNAVAGARPAREVRVGDDLWTLEKGWLQKTRVDSITMRKTRDIVEIHTEAGRIRLTPDHPVMTEGRWKEAGQLLPGDQVEWTRPKSLCRAPHHPMPGYGLGYFLGAVGSDGSVQDGRRITLTVKKRPFAEKFAAMASEAFPGLSPRIEPVRVPSGFLKEHIPMYRVRIVSRSVGEKVCQWYALPEQGSRSKTRAFRFPAVVTSSKKMMQGFLDGYCDGDGYSVNSGGRFIISSNQGFLSELGRYLQTPVAEAGNSIGRVYVSSRWDKAGWFGRHGFKKEADFYVPADSRHVAVTAVRRLPKAKKPHDIYSFKCSPFPSFLVAGHLTHNCEHHLLPFFGKAHVAYVPDGRIVGLSKIPKLVEALGRRLQVQERVTCQIAETLAERLKPLGVGVVIEARHLCMEMRGARSPMTPTVTSAMLGCFRKDPRTRDEFLSLVRA